MELNSALKILYILAQEQQSPYIFHAVGLYTKKIEF